MMEQTRSNRRDFVWTHVRSLDDLGRRRIRALRGFLADYEAGRRARRYVDAALPVLPFADAAFELALSSHFLFRYSAQFDLEFHIAALREMLRVACEVCVLPLLQMGGAKSPHVPGVRRALMTAGVRVTVEPVPYEFQRDGNRMLRLCRPLTGARADRGCACGEVAPGTDSADLLRLPRVCSHQQAASSVARRSTSGQLDIDYIDPLAEDGPDAAHRREPYSRIPASGVSRNRTRPAGARHTQWVFGQVPAPGTVTQTLHDCSRDSAIRRLLRICSNRPRDTLLMCS